MAVASTNHGYARHQSSNWGHVVDRINVAFRFLAQRHTHCRVLKASYQKHRDVYVSARSKPNNRREGKKNVRNTDIHSQMSDLWPARVLEETSSIDIGFEIQEIQVLRKLRVGNINGPLAVWYPITTTDRTKSRLWASASTHGSVYFLHQAINLQRQKSHVRVTPAINHFKSFLLLFQIVWICEKDSNYII
jgi:hypothetical protein